MRALWTLARILVLLVCVVTLFGTVVFVSSPSGTSVETSGVVIDLIALVVLLLTVWSLLRDRRALI